jgi:hypothetical protein
MSAESHDPGDRVWALDPATGRTLATTTVPSFGTTSMTTSGGRSSARTTIRWLAIPSRTRFDRPFSAKNAFSASARAGTSAT